MEFRDKKFTGLADYKNLPDLCNAFEIFDSGWRT
jgi:hypothetical protein